MSLNVALRAAAESASGELWRRLAAALDAVAPGVPNRRLRPPASPAQIEAAEAAMGSVFPPDLRQAYLYADGCDLQYDGMELRSPRVPHLILGGCDWLALHQVVRSWQGHRDVMAYLAADVGEPMEPLPDAAVRDPLWLDPLWIPIGDAHDGAFAAVDLHPGPTGSHGQLIIASAGGAVCTERVLAPSFAAYFLRLVLALERGHLTVSDNQWVDRAGRVVWMPQDLGPWWFEE